MTLVEDVYNSVEKIRKFHFIMDDTESAKNDWHTAQRGIAEEEATILNKMIESGTSSLQIPGASIDYTRTEEDSAIRLMLSDMVKEAQKLSTSAETSIQILAKQFLEFVKLKEGDVRKKKKATAKPKVEYKLDVNFTKPLQQPNADDRKNRLIEFRKEYSDMPGVEEKDHFDIENLQQVVGNEVKFRYTDVLDRHEKATNVHLREGKDPDEVQGTVGYIDKGKDGFWFLKMRNKNLIINGNRSDVTEEDLGKADRLGLATAELPGEFAFRTYRIAGIHPNSLTAFLGGNEYLILPKKALGEGRTLIKTRS